MDQLIRKKELDSEKEISAQSKKKEKKHVSDHYHSKLRPRENYPDDIDSKKRISTNLNKLNRDLIRNPNGALSDEKENKAVISGEDRGIRVVTRAVSGKVQAPLSFIFSLIILVAVFMYMLSLSVQVEEYSHAIDEMDLHIAKLKEEATQLEVQLENKYDLDEVERIATQEYGMVSTATLPKKYISITVQEDVWQAPENEDKNALVEFFKDLFSFGAKGE